MLTMEDAIPCNKKRLKDSIPVRIIETSAPVCKNSIKHYLKTLGICKKSSENHNRRIIKILPPLKLEDSEVPQVDANATKENRGRTKVDTNVAKENRGRTKVDTNAAKENRGRTQVDTNAAKENRGRTQVDTNDAEENNGRTQVDTNDAEENNGRTQVDTNAAEENNGRTQVDTNAAEENDGRTQVDANGAKENDGMGLTIDHAGTESRKKSRKKRKKGKKKKQAISESSSKNKKKRRKKPLKLIPLGSSSSSSSDEAKEPVSKAGRWLGPPAKKGEPNHPTNSSVSHITLLDKSIDSIDEEIPHPYQQPKSTPNNVSTINITSSSSSEDVIHVLSSSDTNIGSSSSRHEIPNTSETHEHRLKENFRSNVEISGDSSVSTEMLMLAGKTCLQNVASVLGNHFQETAVNCIEVLHVNNFNVRLAVKHLISRHPDNCFEDFPSTLPTFTEVNPHGSANSESESEKTTCEICLQKVLSILEEHFGKSGEETLGILHKNKYNILTTIQELQIA